MGSKGIKGYVALSKQLGFVTAITDSQNYYKEIEVWVSSQS